MTNWKESITVFTCNGANEKKPYVNKTLKEAYDIYKAWANSEKENCITQQEFEDFINKYHQFYQGQENENKPHYFVKRLYFGA